MPTGIVRIALVRQGKSCYMPATDGLAPLVNTACGRGGIGRRAALRSLWGNPWKFESSRPHQPSSLEMLAFGIYAKGRSDFPTICIKFCPTRFQDGGLQTKASFLEWRGKRGIFRFFRRVPPDIVDLVGFSFWERSLRTSDEQAAAIKARALAVETDEVIRQARAEREQMAKAAERFREADAKVAGLPKSDQNEIFRLGGAQGLLADTLDDVGQHNFMLAAADMLDPSRFGDEELSDHVRLRLGKMDAASSRSQLDVIGSEITRRTATLRKLSIEVETLAKFRTNDPGIEAVVAHYCATAKLPEQTRRQYGYAARRFAELHGDLFGEGVAPRASQDLC